jgi:hypothetical protein
MQRMAVDISRRLMILTAFALLPLYGLWVAGGAICDSRERKRCR